MGIDDGVDEPEPVPETAFRRIRPVIVGREAPRMARGSEGPA